MLGRCCSASGDGNTFASIQQFICDCEMDVGYQKNVLLFVTAKTLISSHSIGWSWFQACLAIADLSSSHAVSSPCGCFDEDFEVSFHLSFVRMSTVTLDLVYHVGFLFQCILILDLHQLPALVLPHM